MSKPPAPPRASKGFWLMLGHLWCWSVWVTGVRDLLDDLRRRARGASSSAPSRPWSSASRSSGCASASRPQVLGAAVGPAAVPGRLAGLLDRFAGGRIGGGRCARRRLRGGRPAPAPAVPSAAQAAAPGSPRAARRRGAGSGRAARALGAAGAPAAVAGRRAAVTTSRTSDLGARVDDGLDPPVGADHVDRRLPHDLGAAAVVEGVAGAGVAEAEGERSCRRPPTTWAFWVRWIQVTRRRCLVASTMSGHRRRTSTSDRPPAGGRAPAAAGSGWAGWSRRGSGAGARQPGSALGQRGPGPGPGAGAGRSSGRHGAGASGRRRAGRGGRGRPSTSLRHRRPRAGRSWAGGGGRRGEQPPRASR